jgi:hypothetical protein
MFTEGRRGSVRSGLVAQREWGGGEVGCRRELDSVVTVEGCSDGLN